MYWAEHDLTYLYYFLIFILDKKGSVEISVFSKSVLLSNFWARMRLNYRKDNFL